MANEDARPTESLLVELVGERFLEYALNTDNASIVAHFEGVPLDGPRSAALQELAQVLGQLVPDPDADKFQRQLQLDALGTHIPAIGTSYVNTLRGRCGGSIDPGVSTDAVVSSLLPMSRDMYPLFLIQTLHPSGPLMARSLFQHPARATFDDAVLNDTELAPFFSIGTTPMERLGSFISSAGRGGAVQLALFPDHLMRTTWARLRLELDQPNLEQFQEAIAATVGLFRDIVTGRPVSVPVRIGLTGVKLPESVESVALPWGRLRRASDHDRQSAPSSIVGSLTTTTPEGEQVVIDYSGDVILEMDLPYRVELRQLTTGSDWPADLRDFDLIPRRLESIQLGLQLALPSDQQPIVVLAWQRLLDPLAQGDGLSWSDTRRTPNLVPRVLSEADVQEWSEWIGLVDRRRVKSIEIAIRRTIRASVERSDPVDALVDAVIAWENLFGSNEGELTFRITTALAWLLESEPVARRARQTALKNIYRLRSQVVHGSSTLVGAEALQRSRDARTVAIEALRKLIRDRPELLQECQNGSERSLRLIFG